MFSKTTEYAIRVVIYLSVNTTPSSLAGVNEIAGNLNFPAAFLGKVLQDMVKKGLIISVKGPGGGFYLNDNTLSLSILDIVELMEGLGFLNKCGLGINSCSPENPCPIHEEYKNVPESMRKALSIKSICDIREDLTDGNNELTIDF